MNGEGKEQKIRESEGTNRGQDFVTSDDVLQGIIDKEALLEWTRELRMGMGSNLNDFRLVQCSDCGSGSILKWRNVCRKWMQKQSRNRKL